MARQTQRELIGDTEFLAFHLEWIDPPDSFRGLGWCALTLWVGGKRHWCSESGDPVRWTWIDLVEHLARAWGHLVHEETPPFGLVADSPGGLAAAKLLKSVDSVEPAVVEAAVHRYQHRHDLAAGLRGIHLPPVWLTRAGRMFAVTGTERVVRDCDDALGALEKFADAIVARLGTDPKPRAALAAERWNSRAPSPTRALSIRTGLGENDLRRLAPKNVDVVAYWGDATQADESALMAAARLSQPLKALDREAILSAVSKVPHRTTAELDQLSGAAAAALAALEAEKPHQQGYAIALWLRTVLGTSNAAPLDPSSLLRKWDVHVEDLPALDARLDAVACWGKDHGPAVLVNPAGQHSASAAGRRATLAHEILHLLVDRSRELPAAEVFGGATPRHLEQRARAFAAELLLPRAVANRELAKWNSLIQAEKHIRKTYGVSKEVLGWQLKNGSAWSLLDARERALVRQWTRSWVALDSA